MRDSSHTNKWISSVALLVVVAFLAAGCNINVRKNEAGQDKKVDIETPIGDIHVGQGADPQDTGMAVYPGARLQDDKDGDQKNANVNLSAFGFGLRVAAVEYESDDPPAKLIAFYHDQLKKYGAVLECHTSGHNNATYSHHDSASKELTCEQDSGNNIELKAGNDENQHIVTIETKNQGTRFALVHVQVRGRDTI